MTVISGTLNMVINNSTLEKIIKCVRRLFSKQHNILLRDKEACVDKFLRYVTEHCHSDYDMKSIVLSYDFAFTHYREIPGAPPAGDWAEHLFAAGKTLIDGFSAWELSRQGTFGLSQILLDATIARCLAQDQKNPTHARDTTYLQVHILRNRWDILSKHMSQLDKEVVERQQPGLWDRWLVITALYDDESEIERLLLNWLYATEEPTSDSVPISTLPSDVTL